MPLLNPRDEAKLRNYEQILAREPNALVFAALASIYSRKYEFDRAIDVLVRGLENYPNYFSARVLLAKCYLALDRFDDAVAELEKVLAHDPYNVSALGLLGDELRNRGRLGEARDRYLKILELNPENEEYAYKLELLYALTEGGPFAEAPAAAGEIAVPPPEPGPEAPRRAAVVEPPALPAVPAITLELPETEEVAGPALPSVETVFPEIEAAVERPAEREEEETPAFADELATLTLAKIYEDQGLFLRARDVILKVLARDAANSPAREAYDHVTALLTAEQSPTGASIIQLIKKVDAVAGLLEHDELEVWAEISAGVEEALTGFEELTVAQAVAAAAGLTGVDTFTVPEGLPALWEFDVSAVASASGVAEADELPLELPLTASFEIASGANVLALAATPARGGGGVEEFELAPMTAAGPARARAAAPKPTPSAPTLPPGPAAQAVEDYTLDLKAKLTQGRDAVPPAPPRPAPSPSLAGDESRPGAPAPGESTVTPEQYPRRTPLSLDKDPFGKDEDFLGWLDSIKLKGI